jgi:hypothetical protein
VKWEISFSSNKEKLRTRDVTKALANWLCEAALVPTAPNRITILVDSSSSPELASEIFHTIIHRDAASQTATDQYFAHDNPVAETFSVLK